MSVATSNKRLTTKDIRERKGGVPLVSLTAYSTPMARLIDAACDIILVGDSLGMVHHGLETTLLVSLETMILHGQAVMRGSAHAMIVVDMPFGSYEESPEQAFRSAARVMKETGCGGVKLEGGAAMAPTIRFLTARGIPVMAHIGMTPQAVNVLGGFRVQGRDEAQWASIEEDAHAITDAGAFSVVIEAVAEPLAARITGQIAIPTIGIGASAACDGQVLVLEDVLGLSERKPKLARRYVDLGAQIATAASAFAEDVRERRFPSEAETYAMKAKA